ncbi:hypothetical protein Zmor_019259 [Zophobas morio]|uniref:Uncharacterized protein n=1 Tax=Zophobas morio TaxID=2755281 RepID=A0AA38HZW2_9CUCU|nr:hypothetical protein Zmor_019259 [Zophobas morio]
MNYVFRLFKKAALKCVLQYFPRSDLSLNNVNPSPNFRPQPSRPSHATNPSIHQQLVAVSHGIPYHIAAASRDQPPLTLPAIKQAQINICQQTQYREFNYRQHAWGS